MAWQRKVIVEVCSAINLMPKDGQGSSSPYVQVEFDGQKRRTKTVYRDLNPVWNEALDFWVTRPHDDMYDECLEATVLNEKLGSHRNQFLGRVCIPCSKIVRRGEEALIFYPLEKRGLFSHVKGQLGMKVYYVDEEAPPPPPPPPPEGPLPQEPAPPPPELPPAPEPPPPPPPPEPVAEPEPTSTTDPAARPANFPPHHHHHVHTHPPPVAAADPFLVRRTNPSLAERVVTYDLVEKMYSLYVRVVRARNVAPKDVLTASSDPYVRLAIGNHVARTRTIPRDLNPEWNEVFAFAGWDSLRSAVLDVSVWDEDVGKPDDFLGAVLFDMADVPMRVPPDSPLAPQWYKLEALLRGGGRVSGDIMLAVWFGTQADEAFPEAWQSDSGGRLAHTRSKVYMSPKMWYLRVSVLEAQDIHLVDRSRHPESSVVAQLGFQSQRTRPSRYRTTSPAWNVDLMFVAAEPFEEQLLVSILDHMGTNHDEHIGHASIPLSSIERRIDYHLVASRWYNLGKTEASEILYRGRIHLRLCFDGGYHVMDETAQLSSDFRPTARQLWLPPIGCLEVGLLGAQGLLPMKTRDTHGVTDAYAVAKYGPKWVRTRTVIDNFSPRWNEQYTWDVYDPCTVVTVGVFDNHHVVFGPPPESPVRTKDTRIGKIRIRLSTLETSRIYTHSYPLLVLYPSGPKKMGELELAIRLTIYSTINLIHAYSQPLFPSMHYVLPLGVLQQDALRQVATVLVTHRLTRSEPPLRSEVVRYMLDTQFTRWSMRRSKANWFRILAVLTSVVAVARWFDDICQWRNTMTTLLVHVLFTILVCYPELILPTLFLYMFLIGAWHYRFRPRTPSHMDARLSHADVASVDELDEEFDTVPSSKPPEAVRERYERLRAIGYRIQTVLGDIATQGERIKALLSWRDPRATAIFISFCLAAAVVLYIAPLRVVILFSGLYCLRHPRFRDLKPPVVLNFFRRLPSLSDRIL